LPKAHVTLSPVATDGDGQSFGAGIKGEKFHADADYPVPG
jgi:hypothetical protein